MILTNAELELRRLCELELTGKNTNFLSTAVNCGYLSPEERDRIYEYDINSWYQAKKDLAQCFAILLRFDYENALMELENAQDQTQ